MKSKITKKVLLGLLAVAFSGTVATTDLSAQTFTNGTAGVYHATCGAVLRVKSPTTTGTISGNNLGTATLPIPGIVEWATAGQTVPGYYYTRLLITDGAKTMATGIVVTGGACATANGIIPAATADLVNYPYAGGTGTTPTYSTGDFTYAPTDNTVVNIWPSTTTDPYSNLNITTGTGTTVATGQTVNTDHVTTATGTTINIAGNINTGDENSNLAGKTEVNDGGVFTVGSGDVNFAGDLNLNGSLTVPDGGVGTPNGPVTLAGTTTVGTTGDVAIGANDQLIISGGITNAGDGTNLTFACSSEEIYSATTPQNVLATVSTNPYGKLTLQGGEKVNAASTGYPAAEQNNINVCSNFSLADGNLTMSDGGYTGALIMQNAAGATLANVTYTGLTEVVGKMQQNLVTGNQDYTFNNSATTVGINKNSTTNFTMDVRPNTNPYNYVAATDIKRKVTITHDGTDDFDLTLAYLLSESTGLSGTSPNDQAHLRMYENTSTTAEKLAHGAYSRVAATATSFGTVNMNGIGNSAQAALTNGVALFASGNDVLLRAGATQFYSVNDGRWSNPNTWDEQTIPHSTDDVFIRNTVYAGIDAPFVGTSNSAGTNDATNNLKPESEDYTGTGDALYAANKVTIINSTNAMAISGAKPALIIGNEDNGTDFLLKFKDNLVNENTTFGTIAWNDTEFQTAKSAMTSTGGIEGVWLIKGTTFSTANTGIPGLSAKDIQNAGSFNNEGLLEIRGE